MTDSADDNQLRLKLAEVRAASELKIGRVLQAKTGFGDALKALESASCILPLVP